MGAVSRAAIGTIGNGAVEDAGVGLSCRSRSSPVGSGIGVIRALRADIGGFGISEDVDGFVPGGSGTGSGSSCRRSSTSRRSRARALGNS